MSHYFTGHPGFRSSYFTVHPGFRSSSTDPGLSPKTDSLDVRLLITGFTFTPGRTVRTFFFKKNPIMMNYLWSI